MAGPLRLAARPTSQPTLTATQSSKEEKAESSDLQTKSFSSWLSFDFLWPGRQPGNNDRSQTVDKAKESSLPFINLAKTTLNNRYKMASVLADARSRRDVAMLMSRQENTCPKDEEPPEDQAQEDVEEAYDEADAASDEAEALAESDAQKKAAEEAADKAEAAADQATNFLNAFVGPEVLSSAISSALAAAAVLVLGTAPIDSIYEHVTNAAQSASKVLSRARATPSSFPNTCQSGVCQATTTSSDGSGPTIINPPPTSTTSTTSVPTVTGSNGCFAEYEKRIWGVRVPHTRPSYSCYVRREEGVHMIRETCLLTLACLPSHIGRKTLRCRSNQYVDQSASDFPRYRMAILWVQSSVHTEATYLMPTFSTGLPLLDAGKPDVR